jgi:hypothetical protein
MDFDQTWYILSPYDSLEPYWFPRSNVKVTWSMFYFVNTRINILQWIVVKLGTYLVLKRIWNPINFQGHRSRSPYHIFRRGDMPRFALPLLHFVYNFDVPEFCRSKRSICIPWYSYFCRFFCLLLHAFMYVHTIFIHIYKKKKLSTSWYIKT